MNTPRYASGGFIPTPHVNFGCFGIRKTDLYAAVAMCEDPLAESWRWQKSGFTAKVETRKIAFRGAR